MASLYEAVGGFDKILEVTKRWHELCLTTPDTAHPFEHGMHPEHDVRLAAYLAEAFGGPRLYSAGYGDESSVQRIHAGNGVHEELDNTCVQFFSQALKDCGVLQDAAQRATAYFARATAEMRPYANSPDDVPAAMAFNLATE